MWEMVSIFLQAAGVLLLLWLLVGWLVLGKDRGGTAVYVCRTVAWIRRRRFCGAACGSVAQAQQKWTFSWWMTG